MDVIHQDFGRDPTGYDVRPDRGVISIVIAAAIIVGIVPDSDPKSAKFRPQSGQNSTSAELRLGSGWTAVGFRSDRGRVSTGLRPGFGQTTTGFQPDRDRIPAEPRSGFGWTAAGFRPNRGRVLAEPWSGFGRTAVGFRLDRDRVPVGPRLGSDQISVGSRPVGRRTTVEGTRTIDTRE